MGVYYDFIMEPLPGTFSDIFSKTWKIKLSELGFECSNALQLRVGNQLRPKLTCWGAAIGSKNIGEIDIACVSEVASFIEMLHKASIIIDDMIDQDDARHGQHTFHLQYGTDTTAIFALLLIAHGTEGINNVFVDKDRSYNGVKLFANTVSRMAQGGLRELELSQSERFDLQNIRNVIDYETVSLIKNSFLLGYWTSRSIVPQIEDIIENIGKNSGYIFQIYNDLEPFSCIEKNIAYKGGNNIDLNRNRKNIVAAYIYGASNTKEKEQMKGLTGDTLQSLLMSLYTKYSIYELVSEECHTLESGIFALLDELTSFCVAPCLNDFKVFIQKMVSICRSKLRE